MNADETVRALRWLAKDTEFIFAAENLNDAADLIESLQAQLVDYHHMSRLVDGKMSENQRLRRINERLQAQLAELQTDYDILDAANTALHGAFEESRRRADAAVEMLIKFIKQSDDPCDYCKNHIECAGEQCEEFEKGVGGTGNDGTEFPDWHWQCTIFDYGTCAMLANTPCNGCFENDCSGFEWRGPQEAGEGRSKMKSKDRVPAGYREGTRDWNDQYNMLLDDGVTCNECMHVERCCAVFGQRPYINSGRCQFYPNRFKAAQAGKGGSNGTE